MNLADYQELTGLSVVSKRASAMQASIDRAQTLLEDMVGFTLDSDETTKNLYNETGKLQSQAWLGCDYLDSATLDPPDSVVGAYRLFDFNINDLHTPLDPLSAVHAVKLVIGTITVATFKATHYSIKLERGGWGKYLDIRGYWTLGTGLGSAFTSGGAWAFNFNCTCGRHQVRLAVDADWLWPEEMPKDLAFVLADMATYYADGSRNVRSESVGTRSYTKDNVKPPQELPANAAIIARYAGANGTAARMPVL